MKPILPVFVCCFALAACQTPFSDEAEPRWTDIHLQNAPSQSAPEFIAREVQNPEELNSTEQDMEKLLEARDEVLNASLEVSDADPDSEAYAAEARERAEPPGL